MADVRDIQGKNYVKPKHNHWVVIQDKYLVDYSDDVVKEQQQELEKLKIYQFLSDLGHAVGVVHIDTRLAELKELRRLKNDPYWKKLRDELEGHEL